MYTSIGHCTVKARFFAEPQFNAAVEVMRWVHRNRDAEVFED